MTRIATEDKDINKMISEGRERTSQQSYRERLKQVLNGATDTPEVDELVYGVNRINIPADGSTTPSKIGDVSQADNSTPSEAGDVSSTPNTAEAYKRFISSIYSEKDREADEKRMKAAQWVTAAQMLGDSIAALSNVYWTGKGANAQKVEPGAGKAAAATYTLKNDIQKAQASAEKARLDATLAEYQRQWNEKKYADDLSFKKKQLDQAQSNADRAHDFQVQQHKDNISLAEAKAKADAEQNQQRMALEQQRLSIARQEANTRLSEAQRKDKPYPMIVDGQLYEIPISRVNEQMIGSIFAKLPKEVRDAAGQPIYGGYNKQEIVGYKNPSLSDMLSAIGTYGNEETAALIKGLAGEEVKPKITADDNGFRDGGGRGPNAATSTAGSTNRATNGWYPENENDDSPIKKKK